MCVCVCVCVCLCKCIGVCACVYVYLIAPMCGCASFSLRAYWLLPPRLSAELLCLAADALPLPPLRIMRRGSSSEAASHSVWQLHMTVPLSVLCTADTISSESLSRQRNSEGDTEKGREGEMKHMARWKKK